jgi:Flp pilus assembly protein TadD
MAQQSAVAAGKACYQSGELQKAAAHLRLAVETDSRNAEAHYWLGRSYETLADIATPFGRKYRSLARTHLTRAVELEPAQSEYRRELFDFLLDSGDERRALHLLASAAESDPDFEFMLTRLAETRRLNTSLRGRATKLFRLGT